MRDQIRDYSREARGRISEAFTETHTPRATAASFALGAFIVLMPTSGTGLLIFAAIALVFSQVNEVALFSTAIVFNPAVKLVFYGLSYLAGGILLGKGLLSFSSLTLQQLMSFSTGMIVGSLVVATTVSVASYLTVHRLATVHSR